MSSKTEHIAAPIPHQVDGKLYEISPLTFSDFKWLESWAQEEAINAVLPSVEKISKFNIELAESLLDKAHEESLKRKIGSKSFDSFMTSLKGTSMMLYISLRKKHPDITTEEADTVLQKSPDVSAKVLKAAGYKGADEDPFTKAGKPETKPGI